MSRLFFALFPLPRWSIKAYSARICKYMTPITEGSRFDLAPSIPLEHARLY